MYIPLIGLAWTRYIYCVHQRCLTPILLLQPHSLGRGVPRLDLGRRKDSPSCILGNLLACRALVLLVICATRGIWWILEQPMTSVMQYHPMFQRVVRMLGMHKLVISMANYGGPTDKKTILYSSSSIQNRSKLFGKGFYFWPI